jgi:hypothetical protein
MQRTENAGPAMASDFMPALDPLSHRGRAGVGEQSKAILLDDPEEQSRLIKSALFGIKS